VVSLSLSDGSALLQLSFQTLSSLSEFLGHTPFETDGRSFKAVILHEVAHALGLGHAQGDDDDPFRTDAAVIRSSTSYTHLLAYDRACAAGAEIHSGDGGGRRSTYKKVTYTKDPFYGGSWGALGDLTNSTSWTEVTYRSGGGLRRSLTNDDTAYGAMLVSVFYDVDAPFSQYGFTMSAYNYFSIPLLNFDTPPLIYTRFEALASNALQWMLYVDWSDLPGTPTAEQIRVSERMPPTVHYARSSNFFNSIYKRVIDSCNPLCELVKSHITPSATHDPLTDTTIYTIVDTEPDRNGTTASSGAMDRVSNGRINVYPGHSLHFRLRTPSQVAASNHTNPITFTSGALTYAYETDVPVGLACADSDVWTLPYNCMIAWYDRGMLDGRILYTYFRVMSDNTIEWHHQVFRRGGAYTVSGVDLAFFDGTFWMTFKEAGAFPGIVIMEKTSTGYSWGSHNTFVDPEPGEHFTGPPTFLYDSSFEGGFNGTDKTSAVVISQTY
jgi:hypothetical protein